MQLLNKKYSPEDPNDPEKFHIKGFNMPHTVMGKTQREELIFETITNSLRKLISKTSSTPARKSTTTAKVRRGQIHGVRVAVLGDFLAGVDNIVRIIFLIV